MHAFYGLRGKTGRACTGNRSACRGCNSGRIARSGQVGRTIRCDLICARRQIIPRIGGRDCARQKIPCRGRRFARFFRTLHQYILLSSRCAINRRLCCCGCDGIRIRQNGSIGRRSIRRRFNRRFRRLQINGTDICDRQSRRCDRCQPGGFGIARLRLFHRGGFIRRCTSLRFVGLDARICRHRG